MRLEDAKIGMKVRIVGCMDTQRCNECSNKTCKNHLGVYKVLSIDSHLIYIDLGNYCGKYPFNIESVKPYVERMTSI